MLRRLARPVVVALAATALVSAGLWGGLLATYRTQAADALLPVDASSSRVAVVGIDRRALEESGQRWPWPRSLQAQLIERIAAAGPRLIVLDIVYNPATAEDEALIAALNRAGNVLLAGSPELEATNGRLLVASTSSEPTAAIAAGRNVGHAGLTPDSADGVVRSIPLVVEAPSHELVPSLSLAALAAVEDLGSVVTLRPNGVQVGNRFVPTESRTQLRIAYTRALSARAARANTISAADVLASRVPREQISDKVVFVGATDPTLGDLHPTPVNKSSAEPGVLIHANAFNTMVTRSYLATASKVETNAWMFGLALIVALAASRRRLWLATLASVVLVGGYLVFCVVRFGSGVENDLLYPPIAVAVAFAATLGARILYEAAERRRVTGLMQQYVPTPVAKHLLARGKAMGLPPTGRLTFLFTDVVGSTEAWEVFPREMGEAMRRHDELIENAVDAGGGALVRPRGEGDSRFAVFVAPTDAARTALAIDRAITDERWKTPTPIRVRMSLHTGDAELREADYYGSTVNRCARIRGVANAGEIMVSGVTADLVRGDLGSAAFADRGLHELKGLAEPEHVWELLTASSTSSR